MQTSVRLLAAVLAVLYATVGVAVAYRPEDILTYDNPPLGAFPRPTIPIFTYPPDLFETVRSSGMLGQQLIMGYCPEDYKGCYDLADDRVLGCCHINQTCAMQYAPQQPGSRQPSVFLGCVDDPLQLCYAQMCPPGYGCCRSSENIRNDRQVRYWSYCVPFAPVPGWVFDPFVFGPYPPDVKAAASAFSEYCGDSSEVIPWGVSGTSAAKFESYVLFNTRTGPYIDSECADIYGSYCAVGDTCNTQDIVEGQDPSTGENVVITQDTYCCPPDQTLCLRGRDPPDEWPLGTPTNVTNQFPTTQFLGCAIDDRAETCCGTSICSGESKCCAAYIPSSYFELTLNTTIDYNRTSNTLCCPIPSNCCYGKPFDSTTLLLDAGAYSSYGVLDGTQPVDSYLYCGYDYESNPCGIDIMVPEGWLLSEFLYSAEGLPLPP